MQICATPDPSKPLTAEYTSNELPPAPVTHPAAGQEVPNATPESETVLQVHFICKTSTA
jgi:hypothetical protein